MIKNITKYIFLFTVFCTVTGIFSYLTLTYFIKTESTVVIPELVGKNVIYSLEILTDLGLNIKVKGSEYSQEIPKNHIIYQDPGPGTIIKTGRDVQIIFSKGEKMILMPNLRGMPFQQASVILEENDLNLNIVSKTYSETINENKIIEQYPASDSKVNRDSNVDLLISNGSMPVSSILGDYRGLSLNDAILQLEQMGLVPGDIVFEYKKSVPPNIVIDQGPSSGYRVFKHSKINLVLNRNPNKADNKININAITGVNLFRYRTDFNFLKTHIKIVLNIYGKSSCIFDEYVKPNREIWISVPNNTIATLFLYCDDELTITRLFDTL